MITNPFTGEQIVENHSGGHGKKKGSFVSTPAFKEKFKGSVVVDSNGDPLPVYHGTDAEFTEFKESELTRSAAGHGFNFTENEPEAESFGSRTVKAYLNVKNPYDLSAPMSKQGREGIKASFEKEMKYHPVTGTPKPLYPGFTEHPAIVKSRKELASILDKEGASTREISRAVELVVGDYSWTKIKDGAGFDATKLRSKNHSWWVVHKASSIIIESNE